MASWEKRTIEGFEKRARGTLSGFTAFILRGNVVDLAVGIMIGAAFSGVVNGLVTDIITPLIPAGPTSLAGLKFSVYAGGKDVLLGSFIEAIISFLILALVIYLFVVKPVNALMALHKKGVPEPATTRDCPYCLSNVPLKATRCAFCTSPLPPPGQAAQPIPPAQQ